MGAKRQHHRKAVARGRIHRRHMHHRSLAQRIELLDHVLFAAQVEQVVVEPGLCGLLLARKVHGCSHVRRRIVGPCVIDAVGPGQLLEPEDRRAVLVFRPHHPFRAQRVRHPEQIDHVPARVIVLPFAPVRVDKVAVKRVTREFIIETNAVETCNASSGPGEGFVDTADKFSFREALRLQHGHADARHHHGLGVWQRIIAWIAEQCKRCFDNLEVQVGSHAGKLDGAIARRIRSRRLEVVPVDAGLHIGARNAEDHAHHITTRHSRVVCTRPSLCIICPLLLTSRLREQ